MNRLYEKLTRHSGHNVTIVSYGDWEHPANFSLECEDCCEVILDTDGYVVCDKNGNTDEDMLWNILRAYRGRTLTIIVFENLRFACVYAGKQILFTSVNCAAEFEETLTGSQFSAEGNAYFLVPRDEAEELTPGWFRRKYTSVPICS